MTADWCAFDKAYCISLDARTDRREEARAQFAKVGLTDKVEFVVVPKHPFDCEQGVYESHRICMQKGLAAGARQILIFEDDIVFDRFDPERLKHGVHFMKTHPQWHLLFLGCMVKGSRATEYPAVRRIRYRSLTHAYVIQRAFAQTLVTHYPWRRIAYDDFLRDLNDTQFYAVTPMCAFQSNSPSDNERYLPLDRFRRLCGGLVRLQKFDELFHRYKWFIIVPQMLALILLLWVI
jgi:GR25 family glycosyltransferase involved in LPS biosynthesis